MRSSIPSHAWLLVVCFALQCGKDNEKAASGSGAGTSTGLGSAASTSSGCGSDCPASSSFDACGGLIMTSSGIDPDEYVKQANLFDLATVDCRLGPDFSAYHGANAKDDRPTAYEPPDQQGAYAHGGKGMTYQLGGPATMDSGPFGSVVDQVLYVPDDPLNPGLDRISTYDWTNHLISENPMKVWWGTPDCWWPNCMSNPDPAGKLDAWTQALGHAVTEPMFAARTTMVWDNDALVVFHGGFIGATGSQTSSDTNPFFQLPPNKVPTAIAITSYNEFALVTIWDTDQKKGQVAVFALEGKGLTPYHGWYYIGFPSVGSYSAIKLLGYVDLPEIATPTAIAAAGDNGSGLAPGGIELGQFKLDTQTERDVFNTGANAAIPAQSGYAVVLSAWENKATFIDLQPLFQYFRDMYVTTQANFDQTKQADWPPTFDANPAEAPLVLTTLSVDHPKVLLAGRHRYGKTAKAYIASLDGTVTAYDTSSLDTVADATAADVKALFTVKVGQNPVSMAWPRDGDPKDTKASPYDFLDSFVVVSRGDREIDWVTSDTSSASIYRTFTDSRVDDPVDIDIGERAYVMSVTDWKGKKVVSYRFAPTPSDHITPNQSFGMGADGTADVECGGVLPIAGFPFRLSSTNVN